MNEQLRNAVITIAAYMGYDGGVSFDGEKAIGHLEHLSTWKEILNYHQSADDILPVWRKVRDEVRPKVKSEPIEGTSISGLNHWFRVSMRITSCGQHILNGNYEAACIELANIIKSINGKV